MKTNMVVTMENSMVMVVPIVSIAEAQKPLHDVKSKGGSDDEAPDVSIRNRERKVIFDFSDEECEDVISLASPSSSISAPVTPPLSSPTARGMNQINNSFFVSSTPTFSLVSRNPFGFREDQLASAGGGGGSRMWTPGQSGTCSPAITQTGDVPMSEAVAPPPEFAFGSNANGLAKAWEGERGYMKRVVLMISSSLLETQALGVIEKPVPTKPFFNMSLQFYFPM
ncbi:unnamed protein product [Brassica rapa subsp. narinosa]|uniref:Protein BZR1 homolog n=2 Tax=Brassica TaxID=3705 RepID=A0A816SJK0_BRANA|nr:unnamed protein product [Brassica napus]